MALIYFRKIQYFKTLYIRNNVIYSQLRTISSKNTQNQLKTVANNLENEVEDPDKPIEFLKSDAARWKAQVSRTGPSESGPWYQQHVISISLAIFMIYFFFLREESDIDSEFNKNLYDRIDGLEERSLELVREYNTENNISNSDIENRLAEIRSTDEK